MEVKNNSNLTHKLNHMPFQTGCWFAYTGFRYKDHYDVELHDGTVHKCMYPNATSFNAMDGTGVVVSDEDVAFIRLVPDEELQSDYDFTGEERLTRNTEMFGDLIEAENPSGAPFMVAKPDFTKVKTILDDLRNQLIEKKYHEDDDTDHYIYEATMEAFYGEGYFNWLNKFIK